MNKQTAIYMRVSTNQQSTRSQRPDLERWLKAQDPEIIAKVGWYQDKATGKSMERPGWRKLQGAIDRGEIACIVCWRLDRLGRTASGLCKLFEDLQAKKVRLISLRDSIDLGTASGRLIANVLASVAAYETELRGERVRAGQQVARADKWKCLKCGHGFSASGDGQECPRCHASSLNRVSKGKRWGGSQKGRLVKVTPQQVQAIAKMKSEGHRPSDIAKITSLDRSTIYRVLRRVQEGFIKIP